MGGGGGGGGGLRPSAKMSQILVMILYEKSQILKTVKKHNNLTTTTTTTTTTNNNNNNNISSELIFPFLILHPGVKKRPVTRVDLIFAISFFFLLFGNAVGKCNFLRYTKKRSPVFLILVMKFV